MVSEGVSGERSKRSKVKSHRPALCSGMMDMGSQSELEGITVPKDMGHPQTRWAPSEASA